MRLSIAAETIDKSEVPVAVLEPALHFRENGF